MLLGSFASHPQAGAAGVYTIHPCSLKAYMPHDLRKRGNCAGWAGMRETPVG